MGIKAPYPRQHEWREPWDEIIEACKATPNEFGYMLPDRSKTMVNSINYQKKNPPFVTPDGRLRAHVRNSRYIDGKVVCDVYFVWDTTTHPLTGENGD